MTILRHTAAGWTEGASVVVNSGTGSGDQLTRLVKGTGATLTATSAAAMGGATKGLRMAGGSTIHSSAGWTPLTVFDAIGMSCLLKAPAAIPTVAGIRLVQAYGGAGSSSAPRIETVTPSGGSGALRFMDGANATVVTTAAQTLAQWQAGFDIRIYAVRGTTTANGVLQAKITRLLDSVVIMDYATAAGNARTDGFSGGEFGRVPAPPASDATTFDLSYLTLDNAATGLVNPVPSAVVTGVFYSANGSTLTPATMYYSANGTTLAPVTVG